MKKLFLILFMLGGCSLFAAQDETEKFKNPLFYETMEPISKISWKTTVTPTQKIEDNGFGYTEKTECVLLENETTHIALKCNSFGPCKSDKDFDICKTDRKYIYRYTLIPMNQKTESYYQARWKVKREFYDEDWTLNSTASLKIK